VPHGFLTTVDIAAAAVTLIHEDLRPDVALPVLASLVTEAIDKAADAALDEAWARDRETMYPVALRAAHTVRHLAPYIERRRRQLEDAKPRPGDYLGAS
jgi:hypothetical protein